MSNIYFKEIFEYPINEFSSHLENERNERIFFSGKYGIGKTQFLQQFFDDDNQKQFSSIKYDVYTLFPVNYSISSNEDIIKYIKYDIVIELLRKKASVQEIDLRFIDTLPLFIKNNLDKVAANIAYMVPKIGKDLVDVFEKIQSLHKEFIKYHQKIVKSEGDKLIEYLEHLEEKEGGLYENDVITKIITKTISQTQEQKSVLIVDDIDRIDPEHVFRILNVFAAHFDRKNNGERKNKFSFDKIIIVGDFHNIQNLFHHRYGHEVDFIGYIDKFYSSDIYWFDNIGAIQGIVKKIIESISFNPNDPGENGVFWRSSFSNHFISDIIQLCLGSSFINLRSIIKMHKRRIKYQDEKVQLSKDNWTPAWRISFLLQVKILSDFFGTTKNMRNVFEKCLQNNAVIEEYKMYIGGLFYILGCADKPTLPMSNFKIDYRDKVYALEPQREHNKIMSVIVGSDVGQSPNGEVLRGNALLLTNIFFWQLLIDVCDYLYRIGYLK